MGSYRKSHILVCGKPRGRKRLKEEKNSISAGVQSSKMGKKEGKHFRVRSGESQIVVEELSGCSVGLLAFSPPFLIKVLVSKLQSLGRVEMTTIDEKMRKKSLQPLQSQGKSTGTVM